MDANHPPSPRSDSGPERPDPDGAADPAPPRGLAVRKATENWVEAPEEPWRRDDYDRLLDFAPVPRKTKVIRGWTPKKQRGFIAALRESGSVRLSTAEVGMSYEGVYKLRHAPGGEEFARAWDEAVAIGARRVRDVFIDQNIHGIPERVVIGKDVVVERRRFNHRSMIWLLQHHLPEDYPGGSTLPRRGQEKWRKPPPTIDAVTETIRQRAKAIRAHRMRAYAADPQKRAAYELLHGSEDWSEWSEDAG